MSITVEELVKRSKIAQKKYEFATQEQADKAARAICKLVADNAELLGKMAAEESRMGNEADKITKCRMKSALIWHSIKDRKSVGMISRNDDLRMMEIAKPMGVVASVVPSTNPVVTPMCNGSFALKTRNSIIFSPHPRAIQCTQFLVNLFREELAKQGLPEDLIQTIENPTVADSATLMASADVVVATGGMAMVKAAYSSGTPAFGVGAGNVQTIVDRDVDLEKAAALIVTGRIFDNGLICLGEQTAFVHESQYDDFIKALTKEKGHYISDEADVQKIRDGLFPDKGPINRDEKVYLTLFVVSASLCFMRPLYTAALPAMTPSLVLLVFGMFGFIMTKEDGKVFITFEEATRDMTWNILFIVAGAGVLGAVLQSTGAIDVLADMIATIPVVNDIGLMFMFVTIGTLLAQLASATTTSGVLVPIAFTVASALGKNPIPFVFSACVGFSCPQLGPVAQGIVLGYGTKLNETIKRGWPLLVAHIIVGTLLCYAAMLFWPYFSVIST